MSDKLREAAILKQHDIAPHGYFDEHDTGFRNGVRAALADSAAENDPLIEKLPSSITGELEKRDDPRRYDTAPRVSSEAVDGRGKLRYKDGRIELPAPSSDAAQPDVMDEIIKGARWVLLPDVVAAHREISAELVAVAKDFGEDGKYEPRIARAEAHFTVLAARAQSFARFVLQAHPEDAPEGPFHAKPSDLEDDDRWMVVFQDGRVGCIYSTKEEIEDIRDVMNRHELKREVRDKGEK